MKTYINNIKICLLAIGMIFIQSCTQEGEVDQILNSTTQGAVLRTINVNSATFNFFDTASQWSVTVEEQDAEEGKLFTEVKLYATHIKAGVAGTEKLVKTLPASSFPVGKNGLPVGDVSATLAQTLTVLGLTTGQYSAVDAFKMRLVLVLSDGREFTTTNSSASISNAFFSSPFNYSAQFKCPIVNASLFNGTYKVTKDEWADYAVGDLVPVVYDSTFGTLKFKILQTLNPYPDFVNKSTAYMIVTIKPTDGTVTVTSNEDWDYGGGFITTVTGTGNVGSCTGDINLKLNFSGSSQNQAFNIVKN